MSKLILAACCQHLFKMSSSRKSEVELAAERHNGEVSTGNGDEGVQFITRRQNRSSQISVMGSLANSALLMHERERVGGEGGRENIRELPECSLMHEPPSSAEKDDHPTTCFTYQPES